MIGGMIRIRPTSSGYKMYVGDGVPGGAIQSHASNCAVRLVRSLIADVARILGELRALVTESHQQSNLWTAATAGDVALEAALLPMAIHLKQTAEHEERVVRIVASIYHEDLPRVYGGVREHGRAVGSTEIGDVDPFEASPPPPVIGGVTRLSTLESRVNCEPREAKNVAGCLLERHRALLAKLDKSMTNWYFPLHKLLPFVVGADILEPCNRAITRLVYARREVMRDSLRSLLDMREAYKTLEGLWGDLESPSDGDRISDGMRVCELCLMSLLPRRFRGKRWKCHCPPERSICRSCVHKVRRSGSNRCPFCRCAFD